MKFNYKRMLYVDQNVPLLFGSQAITNCGKTEQ